MSDLKLKEIINGYHVRRLTAGECVSFLDLMDQRTSRGEGSPQDDIRDMAAACAIGVVDADNKKVNSDPAYWLDNETLDVVNQCGQAVIESSGLTSIEAERGN